MRILRVAVLAFVLLVLAEVPGVASEIRLSKGLPHYVRDMEFYYLKPRPEILPGLLRTLASEGILDHNEKQFMVAAFLAELASRGKVSLDKLASGTESIKGDAATDARHTLAWAAHLARLPQEQELLHVLLKPGEATLRSQISRSPAPLSAWVVDEPTVPRMFWGAYMATGDVAWLDKIIDAALRYARLNAAGRQHDPDFAASASAAALLYDMAPRHPKVLERVRERLKEASVAEADTLRLVLRDDKR